MPGETDLDTMLSAMSVHQRPGTFVFVAAPSPPPIDEAIEALVREDEGDTVVVRTQVAAAAGWDVEPAFAWLTLEVHSSLEAVGLTAAFSERLAAAGIPCNVLAGFHHDHILVPVDRADDAVECITSLRAR